MKRKLCLLAFAPALFYCDAVQAQSEPTKGGIETVIVTAERRSENLMTTPITADVLNADDLKDRNIFNVNSLQFIAPNVTVNDLGQGIDFNIRGIGKGEHNTQTPAGVVTYRDGVATFPGYLTEEPYFDVKTVEVYRGPQGTFVGQNATGGAVFVTTNDPTLGGGYSGYAQAQYGNYNEGQVQGALDIPITDTLAVRLSGFGDARGSFYTITDSDPADNCPHHKYAGCKPGYNPGDLRWAVGRISALWQATDALKISVKYDADFLDYGAAPAIPFYQLQPVGSPVLPFGIPNPVHSDLFHATSNAPQARLDREQRAIVKADYVFPDGTTLRSITDYNVGNGNWTADLDLTDYGNVSDIPYFGTTGNWTFLDKVDETIWSEEINLISPDNQPITWVAGLYAQSDWYGWKRPYQFWIAVGSRFGNNPTPSLANFFQFHSYTFQGSTNNLDLAAFGQAEAKLGHGVQVSLGGRWTETRSQNDVILFEYGGVPFGTPYNDVQGQKSYNLSYKAAIDWNFDDTDFLYAFVATGYKGGGLNTSVTSSFIPAPFGPETDTDYEAGWKASWLDEHLRTEVDGFYTTYNNFQVTLPNATTPTLSYEINVPKASSIYGLEGETQATFGHLSLSGNVGLLKSSIGTLWSVDTRLAAGAGICNLLTGNLAPDGSLLPGGNKACVKITDHAQTYAPSVTFNLALQYVFELNDSDTLTPRLDFSHQGGQWATLFENPNLGDRLGVRDLLGAQLEWQTGSWAVTAFATNLTNQQYVSSYNSGGLYAGPPRQYGIRLDKAF
jgi:iron complex outermembrane receptor protein